MTLPPSSAIVDWAARVRAGGPVLDVAAGGGRHAALFARRGHPVVAVDRDVSALAALAEPGVEIVAADLENAPWPLPDRAFAAVVVANYLWRPLWPDLLAAVEPGGALLYETFAVGNERFGRPRNPDFLLREGELRDVATAAGFTVIAYAHGEEGEPPSCVRQRLFAVRPATASRGS
ncbi:MAG: class I SAM-dependent methyltransferase [Planctomycetes bacterium]|nr:class I SAM-dependent methyltransferase [Planctomycetota bacterium]